MLSLAAIQKMDPKQIFDLLQELQRFKVQQEQEEAFIEAEERQMLSYLIHTTVQLEFLKAGFEEKCGPGSARTYLAAHQELIDNYYQMVKADEAQIEDLPKPDLPIINLHKKSA